MHIEQPTEADIGREVLYCAGHKGAPIEEGVISNLSAIKGSVFVKYANSAVGQLTPIYNLEWKQK